MELTLEAYRNIVKNVGNRTDLATLCRVCKGFCSAAEKALYNTLSFSHTEETLILLQTLSNNAHLSELVIAVTVFLEEEEEEEEHTSSEDDNSVTGALDNVFIPDSFWSTIANVLKTTKNLRYLHVHLNNAVNPALAWILRGCTFQLRKFHCEFNWDDDLVDFLYSQKILEDLHLSDYRETPKMEGIHRGHTLKPLPLPSLSCLECTFSEAAMKIIPERPITHLKTCFSHSDLGEKRDEMYDLLGKMAQSRKNFRSIDLADSSYTEQFSSELLAAITVKRQLISELRYLGTLVLPINGHEVSTRCLILSQV